MSILIKIKQTTIMIIDCDKIIKKRLLFNKNKNNGYKGVLKNVLSSDEKI